MRKIEQQMLAAIDAEKNWKSGNTSVTFVDGLVEVRLHGHLIAYTDEGNFYIDNCGYSTVTTKSRLNALLSGTGYGIVQRNWEWFLSDRQGVLQPIPSGKATFDRYGVYIG